MQPQRISQTSPPTGYRLPGTGTAHPVASSQPSWLQIKRSHIMDIVQISLYQRFLTVSCVCSLSVSSLEIRNVHSFAYFVISTFHCICILLRLPWLCLIHSFLLGFRNESPGRHLALLLWGGPTAWCLRRQVTIRWPRRNMFCRQDLDRYFAFKALKLYNGYMQTEVKGEFDGDYFQQQMNPHLGF